ncbi:hypothetical protein ACFRCI_16245 [Streptomyces sp. NPDC056638]|uniref:hypothetical protein n=1 Tax=Streptomyces sp. NPDC056638 TaxID=3345887 RepID=UPI003673660B
MDITTHLQLLEAVRRADQADAAYTAASRARARATRAAVDALTAMGRCDQQLAAAQGRTDVCHDDVSPCPDHCSESLLDDRLQGV